MSLLKSNNITSICVFISKNVLAKSSELMHRKEFKEFNINLSLKTSLSEEKRKILKRALNVTLKIINILINVIENLAQKIIVVHFEADALKLDFYIKENKLIKLDQFDNMDFLDLTEENFSNNIKRIENNDNILSNEKEI